jgi:hypothetical protein
MKQHATDGAGAGATAIAIAVQHLYAPCEHIVSNCQALADDTPWQPTRQQKPKLTSFLLLLCSSSSSPNNDVRAALLRTGATRPGPGAEAAAVPAAVLGAADCVPAGSHQWDQANMLSIDVKPQGLKAVVDMLI